MKRSVKILLTMIGLAACSPSAPSGAPLESAEPGSSPIIGGTTDGGDPAVVLMKADAGGTGWWCTGSVIAKRLVLTAAHCVEDATASTKMQIMFGTDESAAKPADYIKVTEWHHDPKYMVTAAAEAAPAEAAGAAAAGAAVG